MKPPDSITDGVVVLRKMRESDRAVVLSTFADPDVRRWLNMPAEPKDSDFDSVLRVIRNGFASGDRYDYCVTEPPADDSLGAVIASRRHRDNYELAYLAREEGRGRGLMTRAVRVLCDWLFEQGVGRIEIRTHPTTGPRSASPNGSASSGKASSGGRSGCTQAAGRDPLVAPAGRS